MVEDEHAAVEGARRHVIEGSVDLVQLAGPEIIRSSGSMRALKWSRISGMSTAGREGP